MKSPVRLIFTLALMAVLALPGSVFSQPAEILDRCLKALEARDEKKIAAIVKENKDKIPQVIKTVLYKTLSPKTTEDEKDFLFYAGEVIARKYNDLTGDIAPLIEIKKAAFDARLTKPERVEPVDGVYLIDLPEAAGDTKNVFKPDNIVIKKGGTVRWVNRDKIAHVFASMSYIGKGGLFVPNLKPGESFDKTFDEPGAYYYICYIHKGMIGKITVEE